MVAEWARASMSNSSRHSLESPVQISLGTHMWYRNQFKQRIVHKRLLHCFESCLKIVA